MKTTRPVRDLQKRLLVVFFCLVTTFLASGCSSPKNVPKIPEFRFVETTLAKGVKEVGGRDVLLSPTQAFTTEDTKVIAHARFENLSGRHSVRWEWYDPRGKLYCASKKYRFKTARKTYVKDAAAWHQMSIKGDEAQNHPGDWLVKIYYDNALLTSQPFRIDPVAIAQKTPKGLPPILSISEISFSKPMLYAGETAKLDVTLKNSGPGDANDVYLELYSNNGALVYESKRQLPVIAKKEGRYTVSIPVQGDVSMNAGKASLDVLVVEPHFRVKIKGKRLIIPTRGPRSPNLILARFATLESESSARNRQIDINEVIDVKVAIQNIGDGPASDVRVNLVNTQTGVMFLGRGEGQVLSREPARFPSIAEGKHQIVNYRFFVNSDFSGDTLEFRVAASEKTGSHGFSETKRVKINTDLQPEGYIRQVASTGAAGGGIVVEDIPDFEVDVDVNIPQTAMRNPDAVAVIIGNRNYQNKDIPAVKYARHDAEVMKQYVIQTLGYKEGNVIFETDASKARFEALFGIKGNPNGILYDYVKPGKSDVLIYYSGHGAPDLKNMKGYFVPVDCDPAKVSLNGYALDLFYENISKIEARRVTVVMDACFSGSTNTGTPLVQSASPALIRIDNTAVLRQNMLVLASSQGDQVSSWYDEKHHGLYTYFFLKAMGGAADTNKDGRLTFQELQDFVADRSEGVPYWAKRLHGGRTQTPTLMGQRSPDVFVNY